MNIINSTFKSNYAGDDYGGAVCHDEGYFSVTDSNFTDNHANLDGGAIYSVTSLKLKNSTFTNNRASDAVSQCHGGAVLSQNNVEVDNCTFLNNHAYDYGGAIYADTITWVASPSYFIGNYVDDNCGGAIYTSKFNNDVKYGVFINNQAKANDDGGAIYINNENYITFSRCYFENNRCGDEGGAIYLDSMYSHLTLKNNVFVDNKAGDKGNIVYNGGYYDKIEYNWFGKNSFDFENELVEYHTWPRSDESHSDAHPLQAMMYIEENTTVLKEANLTIYFSNGNTPGDLFNINAIFSADNDAVLSNWHAFSGSSYVTGITLANINVTHITGQVHHQDLQLDVNPSKGNLRLNVSAESIFVGDNATVIVSGLKNAQGNVSVFVNISEYTGKIDNGVAKIIVTDLKKSTIAGIAFSGDENYNPARAAVHIAVYRHDLKINATAEPIFVGDNATVIVTGLENAQGNVSVFVNISEYRGKIDNGIAKIIVTDLKKSTIAGITFSGDENYNPAWTAVYIAVYRNNLNINAIAEPIFVGDNATVIVTGFKDATGNVTLSIQANNWTGKINNGTAQIIVGGLKDNATADVLYNGDYKYNPASATVNITVYRNNLNINARCEPITAGENATVIVVGLKDARGNVTLSLNNKTYTAPIEYGKALFTLSDLTENVTANVNYAGDYKYNPASTTVNITVNPNLKIIIIAENVTKYYRGPEKFIANIYDYKMDPLVNKSVNLTINGVTYTRITDSNGTVSLNLMIGRGKYDVTTLVDNTTLISSVTILSTVIGSDITKYYKNKTQYSVQVLDNIGKAVGAGEVVTFHVNGISYYRTTNESGIATLNINLPPSEYVITANYKGCWIENNITVLHILNATDITMKYLDGTQFKVNLVDGQGNPYKNQFVRFNVNGIFYDRLTDKNGQAALNIRLPAGEYIITSSFNGANIANKITITA